MLIAPTIDTTGIFFFKPYLTYDLPPLNRPRKRLAGLKKLVADLSLDNAILKEVNRGNF